MTEPSAPAAPDRVELAVLVAVTAIGAGLRLATLGSDSLWFDEAAMYHLVQGTWREILAANATGNSAPPLFPLLLGFTTGPDAPEAMLRAPAAIAGIAAIPLAWLLAREFAPARFALLAPLLVAIAPMQVEYSQEVREYSLAFCAACLMLIAAARFLRCPAPTTAGALAASSIFGISTQYGSVLLALGINIVLLAEARTAPQPPRYLRLWLLSQLPVGVAGILLLQTTLRTQFEHVAMSAGGYRYLLDRYWDGSTTGLWTLLTGDRADIVHFAYPGKLMFALTAIGALAGLAGRGSPRATALLVGPGAVTLAAALAGAYPFGGIRQDMFLTPMIYVCAAIGLAAMAGWLRARSGALAGRLLVAVALAALSWSGAPHTRGLLASPGAEPMRPIAAALAERLEAGDRIYVYWGAIPAFRYYWRQRNEPWIAGATHWSGLDPQAAARQMQDVQRELLALMDDPAPFWLVVSHMDEDDAVDMIRPLRKRGAVTVVKAEAGSALLRLTPRAARQRPP
jgi:hypothetical protein